jgi:hypothetical protein
MIETFNEKVDQIVAKSSLDSRAETKNKIDRILAENVRSIEDLLTFAKSDQADEDLRSMAVWLIGALNFREAIPGLMESLA